MNSLVAKKSLLNTPSIGNALRCLSSDKLSKEDIKNIAPVLTKTNFLTPETEALKRGTGGRSSFSGIVATVFGAPGALGHAVVTRLGRIGSQVIVPYRGEPRFCTQLKMCGDLGQILFVPFYLRDDESIYRALKYSNVVINCIGKNNETPSFDLNDVHVEGARRIARIAREAGVKRFIHVSALNCSPNPTPVVIRGGSQFLKTKYYGELAVREEFPDAVIFRPSDFFGMTDDFLNYYAHWYRRSWRKIYVWRNGRGTFKAPVYIGDVAQGIVNAITDHNCTGKTVDCFGPKKYELHDIVKLVNNLIQKDEFHFFKGMRDLRFSPTFWFRVYLTENLKKYPDICWERIEREYITDQMTPGNLTLDDLAVPLSNMEDQAANILANYKRFGYYDDELGEKPKPDPLPYYPLNYAEPTAKKFGFLSLFA